MTGRAAGRTGGGAGRARGQVGLADRSGAPQADLDGPGDVAAAEAEFLAELAQVGLAVGGEHLVRQREIDELLELLQRLDPLAVVEGGVDPGALRGVEQGGAGFRDEARGHVHAAAQQLGERVAGLILERQLLLPPDEEQAGVFLDLLVGRRASYVSPSRS